MAYTLKRNSYAGVLKAADVDRKVTVSGWVAKKRNLGGLIFVDLRDVTGIVQITFDQTEGEELFGKAASLKSEYVLSVSGTVRRRTEEAVNSNMPTGEIEIIADDMEILSAAKTTPFEIVSDCQTNEELRLRYRYLDLRREPAADCLKLRHRVVKLARDYFDSQGFLEIETPMLTKSTPEGARDYLVPSRVHKGSFYALPQSPQLYKQLLMVAGFDRYMQVVRCFRDEDLRADRQPEFTQIDLEMSFVDQDDVIAVNEGFLKLIFKNILGVEINTPLMRLPYREAMDRFGSDKPDIRFGFELVDITDKVSESSFKVFKDAYESGKTIRGINLKGYADRFSRKDIDALGEFVKTYRAKGLAWLKVLGDEVSSSFLKFISEEEKSRILEAFGATDNDLILIVADTEKTVFASLGALRCEAAERLGIIDKNEYRLLWVTDFPLLEYSEEEGRYTAMHHPFTAPADEDMELLDTCPEKVRAKAYDIVLNGVELGGGSIRINDLNTQSRMFRALGFSEEEAEAKFGFLLEAFSYGAPPHGGLAFGLDRLIMLLSGAASIRDTIAFPKVQNASELMTGCPSEVPVKNIEELGINIFHSTDTSAD